MYEIYESGIWTVIRPVGELDLAAAAEFRATIFEALDQDGTDHLAIDLSEVTFLDSSGIAVIATALKQAEREGGQLTLVGLSQRVRLVLEITGMTKILDIRDDLAPEPILD